MLQTILILKKEIKYYDASDALAVAVCHHFQNNNFNNSSVKKVNGWSDFVKKNPERAR